MPIKYNHISPGTAKQNLIKKFENLAYRLNVYSTTHVHEIIPEAHLSESIDSLTVPNKKTLVDLSFYIKKAQTEYIKEISAAKDNKQRFNACVTFISAFIEDNLISHCLIDTPILVEEVTVAGKNGPCIYSNGPHKNYRILQYSEEMIQMIKLNQKNYIHLPKLKKEFAKFYAAIKTYQSQDPNYGNHFIKTWIMERISTLRELNEYCNNSSNPTIAAHPINDDEQNKTIELNALYQRRRIFFGAAVLSAGALAITSNIHHIHSDWEPAQRSTVVMLSLLNAFALGYFGGKLSWSIDPEDEDPEEIQIELKYEKIKALLAQRRANANNNNQLDMADQPLWHQAVDELVSISSVKHS